MSLARPTLGALGVASVFLMVSAAPVLSAESTVIEITQTGCQFLEPEKGVDHGYEPAAAADCNKVNGDTGADRLATGETLRLKPGTYVFRVTNVDVPYELGFWLREKDYNFKNPVHKLTKTSISGGGMTLGKTLDYEVELKPGEYLYSCPLNPTPNYNLVVDG